MGKLSCLKLAAAAGALVLSLSVTSCQESPGYVSYANVESGGWSFDQAAEFALDPDTVAHASDVTVGVRLTREYAYKELYLLVTASESGRAVWCDTVMVQVYDDGGTMLGSGFPVAEYKAGTRKLLRKPGKRYTLSLTHLMAANPLAGVSQVGVWLDEASTPSAGK